MDAGMDAGHWAASRGSRAGVHEIQQCWRGGAQCAGIWAEQVIPGQPGDRGAAARGRKRRDVLQRKGTHPWCVPYLLQGRMTHIKPAHIASSGAGAVVYIILAPSRPGLRPRKAHMLLHCDTVRYPDPEDTMPSMSDPLNALCFCRKWSSTHSGAHSCSSCGGGCAGSPGWAARGRRCPAAREGPCQAEQLCTGKGGRQRQ